MLCLVVLLSSKSVFIMRNAFDWQAREREGENEIQELKLWREACYAWQSFVSKCLASNESINEIEWKDGKKRIKQRKKEREQIYQSKSTNNHWRFRAVWLQFSRSSFISPSNHLLNYHQWWSWTWTFQMRHPF